MNVILLKRTKIDGEWKTPSSEPIEVSEEVGQSLISKGIAKDANEKEVVTVKDESQTLEIEKLKDDLIEHKDAIEDLVNLLKVSIDSAKGTVPDGAEVYLKKDEDLTA